MKRTPPWVFVAAVGVQLAALGLCVWAMERWLRAADEEPAAATPPPPAEPETQRAALPPAPALTALDEAFARIPEPHAARVPEPVGEPEPPLAAADPPRPIFGPPPERPPEPEVVPSFIVEAADPTSQLVAARAGDGRLAFGFYPDGNIRFVDVDGGRYAGKAESARARMREIGGMRAFTVQIGVTDDGRLQAIFTGGNHDSETFPLEPLVGWSVA